MQAAHAAYITTPSRKRANLLAQKVGEFLDIHDEEDEERGEEEDIIFTDQLGIEITRTPAQGGICIDGLMFPTVMHAFQSHKYCFTDQGFDLKANREKRKLFVDCDLHAAITMGKKQIPHFDHATWEQKRDDIMKGILVQLDVNLRPAKDKTIWQIGIDNYWGNANIGGENRLGKLLESIRDEQAAQDSAHASKKSKRA